MQLIPLLSVLFLACSPGEPDTSKLRSATPEETAAPAVDSVGGDDGDDGDGADGGDNGDSADTAASVAESYVGPSYGACVTDAECAPGDACTTVRGYAGLYCAPPCDPTGDGAECDLGGLDFDTTCTDIGRCAQLCGDDDCPSGLECQELEDEDVAVCAGEEAGGAGNYGTCSHPQAEGSDCPDDSACFGGDLFGSDDGLCLPWCPDGVCPLAPDGVNALPLCYDIGLGAPSCALICDPGADEDNQVCPEGQFCFDASYIGICLPGDADLDIEAIEELF